MSRSSGTLGNMFNNRIEENRIVEYKFSKRQKKILSVSLFSIKEIKWLSRYFRICSSISQTVKKRQAYCTHHGGQITIYFSLSA